MTGSTARSSWMINSKYTSSYYFVKMLEKLYVRELTNSDIRDLSGLIYRMLQLEVR